MPQPLVATIGHTPGQREARFRIENGLTTIRSQLGPFVTSIDDRWIGDRLEFRMTAVGRSVSGHIEVFEDTVRIEVQLPGTLALIGQMLIGRVREQGAILL